MSLGHLSSGASESELLSVINLLVDKETELEFELSKQEELDFASQENANMIWVLITGYLVFFMHAGFSMLEVGSVRHKNAVNIMFKNVSTVAFGGIFYYLLGYGFAYGEDNSEENTFGFIGSGNYANDHLPRNKAHFWFFQFAFAATGATIVSGAIAGRVQLVGYFCIAAWMTSFVYPVVSHWIWATGGWASAFTDKEDTLFGPDGCGVIDFAGSGVVHLTGGTAFFGALIAGPRSRRFLIPEANADKTLNKAQAFLVKLGFRHPYSVTREIRPHNMALVTLGTLILWFGWYGFNSGSTLTFDGQNAAKAAVTTTLSPSAGVVTGVILSRVVHRHYDLGFVLNCALSGLVAITAGCTVVDDWAAIVIGIIAAFVYFGGHIAVESMGVDDPVDAVAVHAFNGAWGIMAVGIFGTPDLIAATYAGRDCRGWETGLQFATQLVGAICIMLWVSAMTIPLFLLLQYFNLWRVAPDVELVGLDHSEHGGQSAFIGRDSVAEEDRAALLVQQGLMQKSDAKFVAQEFNARNELTKTTYGEITEVKPSNPASGDNIVGA